jgi:hypothetical protein
MTRVDIQSLINQVQFSNETWDWLDLFGHALYCIQHALSSGSPLAHGKPPDRLTLSGILVLIATPKSPLPLDLLAIVAVR